MDKISEWRKYLEQETGKTFPEDTAKENYSPRKSTEGVDTDRFKIRRAVPLSEIAPPREKPVLINNSDGKAEDYAPNERHSTTLDDLPPPPAFLKIPGSRSVTTQPPEPQQPEPQPPVVSQPATQVDNNASVSPAELAQRQFEKQTATKPAQPKQAQPKTVQTRRTPAGKQAKEHSSSSFNSIIKTKKAPPSGSSREEILERLINPTITLDEAAAIMGVCKATIRRYTEKGILSCYRTPGNQRRFKLNEVLKFMEDLKK